MGEKKQQYTQNRMPQPCPCLRDGQRKATDHHHSRTKTKLTRCQLFFLVPFASGKSSFQQQVKWAHRSFQFYLIVLGRVQGGLNKEEIWKGAEKGSGKGRKTLRHCLVCSNRSASTWPGIWENKSDFWSPVSLGHNCGLACMSWLSLGLKKKKSQRECWPSPTCPPTAHIWDSWLF